MPRAKSPKSKAAVTDQQQLDFTAMMMDGAPKKTAYSVSEITSLLEEAIEDHPTLGRSVTVQGELSNVKRSSRGHVYFTLKDAEASIGGILWASTALRLTFDLKDGLEVYLTGRLEIYKPSGNYSIVGSKMEPVGIGALQLAFEQIKARLEAEGLFMDEFKKAIPDFPERIGIITSSTGAVIHDMLRVIRRKNPLVDVMVHPVKVQGDGAALEIAQAIEELNHPHYRLDTLIVGRGGGSFEDLFCFSEEPVVRAIFASQIPVITGIGHEPDYALADAVADYSASTPTAAADWAVPDAQSLAEAHAVRARDLLENMAQMILYYEQTLDHNATRLIELHESGLETYVHQLAQRKERLVSGFDLYFQRQAQKLGQATASIDAFNPLGTLARGYGVATDNQHRVICSAGQVEKGDHIALRLADGILQCQVLDSQKLPGA
jgi:exodeoxyribonuclease VII large subunit